MDMKSLTCRLQVSHGFRTFEVWEHATGKLLYQYQEVADQVRVHSPGDLSPRLVREVFEHVYESALATIPTARDE
jgi:hypothetical protein